jgi:hypothetical protein
MKKSGIPVLGSKIPTLNKENAKPSSLNASFEASATPMKAVPSATPSKAAVPSATPSKVGGPSKIAELEQEIEKLKKEKKQV